MGGLFDIYSFLHFSLGLSVTQIIIHYIPIRIIAIILSIILHFSGFGEGVEGLVKCGNIRDPASMQNFLGDKISYIAGAFLGGMIFLVPLKILLILQVIRLFGLFLYCKNI